MANMKTQPPQTYSRLFRPWDTKNSQNDRVTVSSSGSESSENQNLIAYQEMDFGYRTPIFDESIKVTSPTIFPTSFHMENSSSILSSYHPAITPDFYYTNNIPISLMGVEPMTAVKLMEQEYCRVMAEDAQTKAINARKQRPKKFKCPHCNVAFSNNGQLKGHIRIHTGERPFKCDFESCGKTFTRNEELTRHKRIHTGLRPFACSACGKKFGRRDHLKKHTKTHLPQDRHLASAIFVPMYSYLYGY